MKIGLIFSEKRKINLSEFPFLWEIFSSFGCDVFACRTFESGGFINFHVLKSDDEVVKNSDIVLAFGGDGTIIKAAKTAAHYGVPVFGVNVGHLGFLSGAEKSGLDALEDVLSGRFEVSERMMLEC